YEEAAGQGVVAGINAGAFSAGRTPLVLGRESSYIGVLIDDLVTKGVDEPYRLFTSRSEFRLTVRQDNALRRLAPIGASLGLYSNLEQSMIDHRLEQENHLRSYVDTTSISPEQAEPHLTANASSPLSHSVKLTELARRPGVSLAELLDAVGADQPRSREVILSTELEIKYAGYFNRERMHAERMRQMGDFRLPGDLAYESMQSLSFEARQKLSAVKPRTLAQASSIPGVSPSDLQNLVIEVERNRAGRTRDASPVES